jgi:transposase InsO family protein
MSAVMDEEIKRWTARRKSALVLEIIQGKTTVSEASRQFDYNHRRPHQALGMKTPAEAYALAA